MASDRFYFCARYMGTRKKIFYFFAKDKTHEPHYHSSGSSNESRHTCRARCARLSCPLSVLQEVCLAVVVVVLVVLARGGGGGVGFCFSI